MKTVVTVLLLVAMGIGMLAPAVEAWGGGPRVHVWGPAALLAAPLIVAGALVAAPFVVAESAIAAAVPAPVVAAPPVVVTPPAPVVAPRNYWYYCQEPAGYYPYVRRCPTPWLTVVPPGAPPGRR